MDKDKNIRNFNKEVVKKGVKNPQKDTCKKLILDIQNFVNNTDIDILELVNASSSSSSKKQDNVTKVEFVKKTTIGNKSELLEFYKLNVGSNRKLPTKKQIAEITSLSESAIFRYNKLLKDENKIETRGNSTYLCEGV